MIHAAHPAAWRALVVHLRVPFQLLLAPVFLWGWLLGGGGLTVRFALAFVTLHVFIYGGVTAFNSYYDRDEGPVGGLERPPPVLPELLPFSIAVQVVGLLLALLVAAPFALACVGFVVLSTAYSHPAIRLKAYPWVSMLTVGFGQGVLAYLAGWVGAGASLAELAGAIGLLGLTAATLIILGLYPLSQLYQVEEDRARGDRTVAVAWGSRRCFAVSLACTAVGGLAMLLVVGDLYGPADAILIGFGLLAQLLAVSWWARHFDIDRVLWNFHFVMRLNAASAAALASYLSFRLVAG
ncbi:MAG: UbiA family prenyltransferase [Chloroflexi bacterium]|nr:UbiA family prenyltransferase [Chloroflexota bacterium]